MSRLEGLAPTWFDSWANRALFLAALADACALPSDAVDCLTVSLATRRRAVLQAAPALQVTYAAMVLTADESTRVTAAMADADALMTALHARLQLVTAVALVTAPVALLTPVAPPGLSPPAISGITVSPGGTLLDPSTAITLTAGVVSAAPASSLKLLWTQLAGPAVNLSDATVVGTSPASAVLGLLPGALQVATTYVFQLNVADAGGRASSRVQLRTLALPVNGTLAATPASGITALTTPLTLSTAAWIDANPNGSCVSNCAPMTYAFAYVLQGGGDVPSGDPVWLCDFGAAATLSGVVLPPGNVTLHAYARNALGGTSAAPATFTVAAADLTLSVALIETLLPSDPARLAALPTVVLAARIVSVSAVLADPAQAAALVSGGATSGSPAAQAAAASARAYLAGVLGGVVATASLESPVVVVNLALAVAELVSVASQVNAACSASALATLLTLSGVVDLTQPAAVAVLDALTALVSVSFDALGGAGQFGADAAAVLSLQQQVANVTDALAATLLDKLMAVPGGTPVTLSTPLIQLYLAAEDPSAAIQNRLFDVPITAPGSGSSVTLPDNALAGLNVTGGVRVYFASFAFDPHVLDVNQTGSGVTRLELGAASGSPLQVANLSSPVRLQLPPLLGAANAGGKAQCQFWDYALQAYSTVGCATSPDPTPSNHVVHINSALKTTSDADIVRAWSITGPLAKSCRQVVLNCAAPDAASLPPVYADPSRPFTSPPLRCSPEVGTSPLYIFSGGMCGLIQVNNSYGCWWSNDAQAFTGPGCVRSSGPMQCACRHLTDFGGVRAPSIPMASLSDLASLVRARLRASPSARRACALTCLSHAHGNRTPLTS